MQPTDGQTDLIYLDNAATSWPKPPEVMHAMQRYLQEIGATPGRSGHRLSIEAARLVYEARESLAILLGAHDPLRVVFSKNVTEALNLALYGLLQPGDHVVTSSMEHNAVMRPLRDLESAGVELTIVPCSPAGELEPGDVEKAIRPSTRMIVMNHASNVLGTLLPAREVGEIARRHDLLFLLDTAQTAGSYPIDMEADYIDLLGFTGHKALLGPQGTGGLIVGDRVPLERFRPLIRGGTGSSSEKDVQPGFLPDKYESGTGNAVGIVGLGAAVDYLLRQGVDRIRQAEMAHTGRLFSGLAGIPGVTLYGTRGTEQATSTVALNIEGLLPSEAGERLDEEYGILCRVGLHCAPAAHCTMGTFPKGTLRFSPGPFTTDGQIDAAIGAVALLAREAAQ